LFGSVRRGESSVLSDLDLLVDMSEGRCTSGIEFWPEVHRAEAERD
jgi:predicted nucleotidyltransferase